MTHRLQTAGVSVFEDSSFVWVNDPASARNQFVSFQRRVLLDSPVGCKLHLFADTRYRLWVNGRFVGHGPGVHIVMLPPYSPELNPIEKLWDLIQDHTSNKLWPSIERLDQVVALHLKDWWEDPGRVIRLVGNGWIRASANAS